MEEVWEALETTIGPKSDRLRSFDPNRPATANAREVAAWRDSLMRFLTELSADMTVGEVREALEEWSP